MLKKKLNFMKIDMYVVFEVWTKNNFSMIFQKHKFYVFFANPFCFMHFLPQECDQVHIDDVSSDDNGQDLR